MSDAFDQDRTEAPTPQRRQEARRKGNVARSGDLCAAAALVGLLLMLRVLGPRILESWRQITLLLLPPEPATHASGLGELVPSIAGHAAVAVLPLLLAGFLLAIAANLGQVGFLFVPGKVGFRFEAVDPARGASRIYGSKGTYVGLLLNLVKLASVGLVAWLAVRSELPRLLGLPALDVRSSMATSASIVFGVALKLAICLLILGVADYGFQRWTHERQLRMTRQQLRDELKVTEGDPQIRARRRQLGHSSTALRLEPVIAAADVLVVDTDQYAVALSLDPHPTQAARVVGRAAGVRAGHLLELARAHGVPVVETGVTARDLFRSISVGSEIPQRDAVTIARMIERPTREPALAAV